MPNCRAIRDGQVPQNAKQLTITIFDPRQTLVKVLTDEKSPQPGARTFSWNFKTDDGVDAGTGISCIAFSSTARRRRAWRSARHARLPDALGAHEFTKT